MIQELTQTGLTEAAGPWQDQYFEKDMRENSAAEFCWHCQRAAYLFSLAASTTVIDELWPTQQILSPEGEKLTPCTHPPVASKMQESSIRKHWHTTP